VSDSGSAGRSKARAARRKARGPGAEAGLFEGEGGPSVPAVPEARPDESGPGSADGCVAESLAEAPAPPEIEPETATGTDPVRWRRMLAGGTPREVLARITQGDPLGLAEVVGACIEEGAWLVDADRLHLRGLARVARFAARYHGRPPLEVWLRSVVEEALVDVMREDLEGEGDGEERPFGAAFVELSKPLGLDPECMRGACTAFNRLERPVRRAFQALVVQGRSLDELAPAWNEPATAIARRARRALDVILTGGAPGGPSGPAEELP